tara:strand:+ start:1036 stop:1155 length:120 start_codon:yes stop_codon:yes gene_type:complete
MLHQPLRGLDGFSARASLQNRRKCRRYVKKFGTQACNYG